MPSIGNREKSPNGIAAIFEWTLMENLMLRCSLGALIFHQAWITGEARKAPIFIYGDIRALLRSRKELALHRACLYNIEHEYY